MWKYSGYWHKHSSWKLNTDYENKKGGNYSKESSIFAKNKKPWNEKKQALNCEWVNWNDDKRSYRRMNEEVNIAFVYCLWTVKQIEIWKFINNGLFWVLQFIKHCIEARTCCLETCRREFTVVIPLKKENLTERDKTNKRNGPKKLTKNKKLKEKGIFCS